MAARRSFVKNGIRQISRWPFPVIIYNRTVNQNAISRYVKVIQTFMPIFSVLYAHFGTISDITLVFVVIASWFTADLQITTHSFIWYQFEIHLRLSFDPQEVIFTQKYNTFMTCSQLLDT